MQQILPGQATQVAYLAANRLCGFVVVLFKKICQRMKLFAVSLQRDSAFAFILKVILSSSPKYNSRAGLVLC